MFDAKAKQHLEMLNEKFAPWYVFSSSWEWLFDKAELVAIMQRNGLRFVLHPTWPLPNSLDRECERQRSKAGLRCTQSFPTHRSSSTTSFQAPVSKTGAEKPCHTSFSVSWKLAFKLWKSHSYMMPSSAGRAPSLRNSGPFQMQLSKDATQPH